MGVVDFDTEEGEAWYSMVRTLHLAGRESPHTRPAVDERERALAWQVNNHAFRMVRGYQRPDRALTAVRACDRCGSLVGPLRVVGAVYTRTGRTERYRCEGC